MILLIYIIAVLLFPYGFYKILRGVYRLPDRKSSKVISDVISKGRKSENKFETYILNLSSKLGEYIKLSDFRKKRIDSSLKSAQIYIKAETYIARTLIYAGVVFIFAIPAFLIKPFIGVALSGISVFIFFYQKNKVDEILKKKRKRIEYELPQFAKMLSEELKTTNDIVSILEKNKEYLNSDLKNELEILLADMGSGSYEQALIRLETRVSSSQLNEIISGLTGVLKGDDQVNYFENLSYRLKHEQLQKLKKVAMKRPSKMTKYLFSMVGCFMLMYIVILGKTIIDSFSKMF